MKKLLLVVAAAVVLAAGCSTKIQQGPGGSARLEGGRKILVAIPADGTYGSNTYQGSGLEVAALMQKALSPKAAQALISSSQADRQAALREGAAEGCRYVFYPEISHWEPRAAAWSGRPTRVSFYVTVYDLAAGNKAIIQRSVEARGRIVTLFSQEPAEIAAVMFKQLAETLF